MPRQTFSNMWWHSTARSCQMTQPRDVCSSLLAVSKRSRRLRPSPRRHYASTLERSTHASPRKLSDTIHQAIRNNYFNESNVTSHLMDVKQSRSLTTYAKKASTPHQAKTNHLYYINKIIQHFFTFVSLLQ